MNIFQKVNFYKAKFGVLIPFFKKTTRDQKVMFSNFKTAIFWSSCATWGSPQEGPSGDDYFSVAPFGTGSGLPEECFLARGWDSWIGVF